MKILLTGAFGNIGTATLKELIKRGYQTRCFDVKTKANKQIAKEYKDAIEICWGDLRHPEDVARGVRGCDYVIHLAFVIPKLSATGVNSEDAPEWARKINVDGMRNLIHAMKALPHPPKILFTSSLHVYGKTQDQPPPRRVDESPHPIEHYAKHKVICEQMVKESGLEWAIFRLGASMPVRLILDPGMFDVPLNNRIEYVHSEDVAVAIGNALESEEAWGKTWLIGGGQRCQLYQREIIESVLEAVGVGMLPEEAFTKEPYPTDWLDTTESQKVLKFQRHTLQDYVRDVRAKLGFRRHFIQLFRPIIRAWILSQSPMIREKA
ncbi:MAG: NAD(P)-dependent oxidoreductase [Chloroflexota bacterium]